MNKKLVGMLTAVVSVFLCAFGFAGCEEPEQCGSGGIGQGDGVQTEPSYTVSEEEWDDALELKFKNVTFTFTLKDEQRGDGYLNLKLTQDGSLYQKSEGLGWGEHFYKVNADGTVSYCYKNAGQWVKGNGYDTVKEYEEGNYGDDVGLMRSVFPAVTYSSCTYDETNAVYKGTLQPAPDVQVEVQLKFENKKLVSFAMSGGASVVFYDYGTTVIQFPEVAE